MRTSARVAAFVVLLLAVVAAGFAVGRAAGPVDVVADGGHGDDDGEAAHGEEVGSTDVAGLAVTAGGYTLVDRSGPLTAGTGRPVALVITGPDGRPLTNYRIAHEKELHLIAVRRDLAGYQHVHPVRDSAGVWRTTLDLTPGTWRLFADFEPGDGADGVTLGLDVQVAGSFRPVPLQRPADLATVAGHTVRRGGELRAGTTADVTFTVTRDGRPIVPEPYLGARGHLVVLRAGDLAYLHVHPDADELRFATELPTPGRYVMFLDVKLSGVVGTAVVPVEVTA